MISHKRITQRLSPVLHSWKCHRFLQLHLDPEAHQLQGALTNELFPVWNPRSGVKDFEVLGQGPTPWIHQRCAGLALFGAHSILSLKSPCTQCVHVLVHQQERLHDPNKRRNTEPPTTEQAKIFEAWPVASLSVFGRLFKNGFTSRARAFLRSTRTNEASGGGGGGGRPVRHTGCLTR